MLRNKAREDKGSRWDKNQHWSLEQQAKKAKEDEKDNRAIELSNDDSDFIYDAKLLKGRGTSTIKNSNTKDYQPKMIESD